jgi:outer membrane protein TolC
VVGRNPLQFNVANEVWSLGAPGTQVLFNSGLTSAQVDTARAVYWQSVANYRQTVLTAFQQAEDQLAPVRILRQQLVMQQRGKGRTHCGRRLLEPVQGRLRWRSRL